MTSNIRLSNYLPFSLPIDRCRGIRSLVEHVRLVNMRERLPWQRSSAHSARVLFGQISTPEIGRGLPALRSTLRPTGGTTVCAEGG